MCKTSNPRLGAGAAIAVGVIVALLVSFGVIG